jgi:hypothetical protein
MPATPSLASPPAPAPALAAADEMEVLRSEISGLRDRLRLHVMEARQPLR